MAADTCLDGGSGGLEVEAPPPPPTPRLPSRRPQLVGRLGPGPEAGEWPAGAPRLGRARRPGRAGGRGPGGGRGGEAGGSPGPRGRRAGRAHPAPFVCLGRRARGRSRAGARGEGPPVPLEPRARAGIPAAAPRPPGRRSDWAPRAPQRREPGPDQRGGGARNKARRAAS